MYMFVYVFLEGRRHKFSANLVSILTYFWEASESNNQETEVPERCEKTAPKTELRAGKKVVRDAPPGGEQRGEAPLNNSKDTPVHTHHRAQ